MNRFKLPALFSALALLCFAAVGRSNPPTPVMVMDYEDGTRTFVGYPFATAPPGWYALTGSTQFQPGTVGPVDPKFPPSPCRGITIAYNALLSKSVDGTHPAFTRIFARFAKNECTIDMNYSPPPQAGDSNLIDTFRPTGE